MDSDKHVIEGALSNLKYHFDQYKENKYNSKAFSRKPDRERAHKNMITSSTYLENLLTRQPLVSIIRDGNQFQFEDFWRYVESDVPDYILKIEDHIKNL